MNEMNNISPSCPYLRGCEPDNMSPELCTRQYHSCPIFIRLNGEEALRFQRYYEAVKSQEKPLNSNAQEERAKREMAFFESIGARI